jgi:hypothetical protein
MKRFRFHLGTLVILVLLLGVSFAALRESNDIWDSSIFSITIGVLLISILLAIHRAEKRRAYWLGFALFGSVYLGLSLVPSIESRLITTRALAFLDSKMARSIPAGLTSNGWTDTLILNNSQSIPLDVNKGTVIDSDVTFVDVSTPKMLVKLPPSGSSGTTENFVRIGHSLFAVIAALLGGMLSRYLHTKNKQGTSVPAPAPFSISNDSRV